MSETKVNMKEIKNTIFADSYSQKDGVVTVRWGFFYTMGRTTEKYVETVKASFPGCTIVDSGQVWKPFRGGASVAQGSHFFVKFSIS
jgi:hypothetical protein